MSLSTRKLGSHEQGGDFAAVPEVGYEEWRAVVCSIAGRYNPVGIDPNPLPVGYRSGTYLGSVQTVLIAMLTASSGRNGMCALTM
jgi:hypothetical protein